MAGEKNSLNVLSKMAGEKKFESVNFRHHESSSEITGLYKSDENKLSHGHSQTI
jgi:hypothetical protein